MDLSFVIPTHNRPEVLAETLTKLGGLDCATIGRRAELILVDNNSDPAPVVPSILSNGIVVQLLRLRENIGAAARNLGAQNAHADWVVMLDDDSSLLKSPAIRTLRSMPDDVHAVGGEILLPSGAHESGGLPEVVIGCGCAYRRTVFNELGGYDRSFDYYAEEYDLCARIILGGGRIVHHGGLVFEHRKSTQNRSFDRIIHRLVRNNGWVIRRYAPRAQMQQALEQMIERYAMIARKEGALDGYQRGFDEFNSTLGDQPSRSMSEEQWDRFVGIAAARDSLSGRLDSEGEPVHLIHLIHPGKGEAEIRGVLARLGVSVAGSPQPGGAELIGTLSPGPMRDAQTQNSKALAPYLGYLRPGG